MTSLILYRWRVFCVTENQYRYVWLDETQGEPTTCPVNTAHTIDAGQNRIVEVRNPSVVEIEEEKVPSGGHTYMQSIEFDALPNQITTYVVTFPIPINVIAAYMEVAVESKGDRVLWEIAPKTTVGVLTGDVAPGSTVLPVSTTVTDNVEIGFLIYLSDGVNLDDVGRVINVDKNLGQITVETPTVNSFAAATPTFVQLTVRYVDIELGNPGSIAVGTNKIGTAHLPAGTPLHCCYDNKDLSATKRFVSYVEYLY